MLSLAIFSSGTALSLVGFRQKPVLAGLLIAIFAALFSFASLPAFLISSAVLFGLILGLPIFVLMGLIVIVSFLYLTPGYETAESFSFIIRKIQELGSKEILLAIPFFVLAGEIMTQGSIAEQLIRVAKAGFGFLPGGLAVAAVSGCVFFAAISGSSPVTVIAIGSIMYPALTKAKYGERFSMGLLTTAGSLGILIPPSIPMIVYALMVSHVTPMDPTHLFLAGIVPGLMLGGALAAYAVFVGIRTKQPREPFSLKTFLIETKKGFWSLMLPVVILGGIYSGLFTPTEAAAVSVCYALFVELVIHREMKPSQLIQVAEKSMVMVGSLLLIMALAVCLNHFLVLEQIPDQIVEWIQKMNMSRTQFLIAVNLVLLVAGMFMDSISAILILAPMIAPMTVAMNVDPLHMGIIFIVNLEIGYMTPPVGLNLFVASTLFKKPLGEVIRSIVPTTTIMLIGLVIFTWLPEITTKPVEFMLGKNETSEEAPKIKTLMELMQEQEVK